MSESSDEMKSHRTPWPCVVFGASLAIIAGVGFGDVLFVRFLRISKTDTVLPSLLTILFGVALLVWKLYPERKHLNMRFSVLTFVERAILILTICVEILVCLGVVILWFSM